MRRPVACKDCLVLARFAAAVYCATAAAALQAVMPGCVGFARWAAAGGGIRLRGGAVLKVLGCLSNLR